MRAWMRNGVKLGWLIHPERRTVYIYRGPDSDPEQLVDADMVRGEGPVDGFTMPLRKVWQDLY